MTEYFNQIHHGIPLTDVEIIDLHAHLGPARVMHTPANDPVSMIKMKGKDIRSMPGKWSIS